MDESGEPFRRAFRAIQARDGQALGRAARPATRASILLREARTVRTTCSAWPPNAGLRAPRPGSRARPAGAAAADTRTAPTIAGGRPSTSGTTAMTSGSPACSWTPARVPISRRTARARTTARSSSALTRGPRRNCRLPERSAAVVPGLTCASLPASAASILIQGLVREDGSLRAEAGTARGFYSAGTRLSIWQPSDDPAGDPRRGARLGGQERSRGRPRPARRDLGAALDGDPLPRHGADLGRGQRPASLRSLACSSSAADVNHLGTFGGPDHGPGASTAAAPGRRRAARADSVEALLAAGADPYDRGMRSTAGGPRAGPTSAGTGRSPSCSPPRGQARAVCDQRSARTTLLRMTHHPSPGQLRRAACAKERAEPHARLDHPVSPARCCSSTCTLACGSPCGSCSGSRSTRSALLTMIVSLDGHLPVDVRDRSRRTAPTRSARCSRTRPVEGDLRRRTSRTSTCLTLTERIHDLSKQIHVACRRRPLEL